MSNVNVYFGAQPTQGQIVADVLKARGIELLKIEPSKVNFHGAPTTVQPGYSMYKAHLPTFIKQAMGEDVIDMSHPYQMIPVVPEDRHIPINFPSLAVSWNIAVADEVRQQMREKGWVDTVIRGKVAMLKRNPKPSDARDALERGCIATTPCPEDTVNIVAFRKCYLVRNILTVFLSIHQYPAFIDSEHEGEFNKNYREVLNDSQEVPDMETDTDEVEKTAKVLTRLFKVSLQHDPHSAPIVFDEHAMPRGEGLLFPFVPELARFDRTTVIETIRRYFYCGLGDTAEDCEAVFEEIVAAWGNIQNSLFGNIMAHMFKVIDIAMTLQCVPHPMMTAGQYDGVFMKGAGFRVTIMDRLYVPASRGLIDAQLPLMDNHANNLWKIVSLIVGMSDEEKRTFFLSCRSIKTLRDRIQEQGITGGQEGIESVKKAAKGLNFPDDKAWEPTAFNIGLALSYITEPTKSIDTLPYLHPSTLFETDRTTVVWSAFGSIAPSFRVPGGKEMYLTKSFRITNPQIKKEKGPQGHRDVTKIGCVLVPLEIAITHLKTTLTEKTVLNPHGNNVVNASSSHANKVFEGDSCSMIVDALRKAAKVTVVDERGSNKRKNDSDEGGSVVKKGRPNVGF